jgi:hypothetical protein
MLVVETHVYLDIMLLYVFILMIMLTAFHGFLLQIIFVA